MILCFTITVDVFVHGLKTSDIEKNICRVQEEIRARLLDRHNIVRRYRRVVQ